MGLILLLLTILLAPYAILTLLDLIGASPSTPSWRGRLCLSIFFLFTGIAHFFLTAQMARMLPPWVGPQTGVIIVTGLLEIAGAIGIWVPRFSRAAGIALLIFLAAVFPANVFAALHPINVGGQGGGPLFLAFRAVVQLALMAWIWFFTVRASPGTGRKHLLL